MTGGMPSGHTPFSGMTLIVGGGLAPALVGGGAATFCSASRGALVSTFGCFSAARRTLGRAA